jgi:hypothetical protein
MEEVMISAFRLSVFLCVILGAIAFVDDQTSAQDSLVGIWPDQEMTTLSVFPSDGSKFLYPQHWAERQGHWGFGDDNSYARFVAGDFNGDGRTDVGAIWDDGGMNTLTVRLSTGTQFNMAHWLTRTGGWVDTTQWTAGDFNGDGKSDIAGAWEDNQLTSIAVYLSDGQKFLPPTQWSIRDGGFSGGIFLTPWVAGDFNGDGKTDLATAWNDAGNNTLTVRLSTGGAFAAAQWLVRVGTWGEFTDWKAGDFNGDGKSDVAGIWDDGGKVSIAVYLSNGDGFLEPTQWSLQDGDWDNPFGAKYVAGDFNGDGRTDIATTWDNGGSNNQTVRLSTGSAFTVEQWSENNGGWSLQARWLAGNFAGGGTTPPPPRGIVTIERASTVFDMPDGEGQEIATLAEGADGVTLVTNRKPWFEVKWPDGQGWVYSGEGYEEAIRIDGEIQ